jgi:hypothetical protein
MKNLLAVSSALTWGLSLEISGLLSVKANYIGCERFIRSQIFSLPDWLKLPFILLAYFIQFLGLPIAFGWFNRQTPEMRNRIIKIFETIPGPTKEFIRFHRVLVNFYFSESLELDLSK